MKIYNESKQSGIDWIGEVPVHWSVKKLSLIFKFATGFTPSTSNSEFYEDGDVDWVTISDMKGKFISSSESKITLKAIEGKQFVPKGALMYSFKLSVGKVAFAGKDIYTNEAIFSIFPDDNLCLQYYYYLLPHSLIFNANENIYGAKILNQEIIKASKLIVPPLYEQQQIAKYLDHKTAQIDKLISDKEKLIELLKEERTAVINHAVTKGINPDAKMKDSGIEWLGEIPEHWDVWKLSHAYTRIGSGTTPESGNPVYYEGGTINWLNTGDLNDSVIHNTAKKITEKALTDYSALKLFPPNTVVIAMYGATIGKASLVNCEITTNQACCVFYGSKIVCDEFLFYWFIANKQSIVNLSKGGGQPNISSEILKNIKLACPDKVEQDLIVEYIKLKTNRIDLLINKIQNEKDLLDQYKSALISEVVTGKVDVRGEIVKDEIVLEPAI
jgi:type I restriction enzyme S subunit